MVNEAFEVLTTSSDEAGVVALPKGKTRSTLWFGILGGFTLFVGVVLVLWEHLLLLSGTFKILLCAIPFMAMSVWVVFTHQRKLHPAVEEVINALWAGSWWFSMLMVGAVSELVEVNASFCLWVTLLTFPMVMVRYSHVVVGLMTLLMPLLPFAAWNAEVPRWEAWLFVVCALAPLGFCWYQWRAMVRKEGFGAIALQWVYALAFLCYASAWMPLIFGNVTIFEVIFTEKMTKNLISLSLVAPLLLGSLEEHHHPFYRRPLMFMGLCFVGALSLICCAAGLNETFVVSWWDHFSNAFAMIFVIVAATRKTFYREGLFLPFIPILYVSLLLPYALFVMPLIAGAVMIWVSLRREELLMAHLALGYSLASLWINLFAARDFSLTLSGSLLILCGLLFLALNMCYNRLIKRGEG